MRALVPLTTGLVLRNVLRTDLHAEFVARGVEPVYLVPAPLLEQLRESGGDAGLMLDVLPPRPKDRTDKLLQSLAYAPIMHHHDMATIRIKQQIRDREAGRAPFKERFLFPVLGRSWATMHVANWLRGLRRRSEDYAPPFAKWQPDVVFSNHLFARWDAGILWRAHVEGVRTVGMVHSWDNPSNKAVFPPGVDRLLVWGPVMRREMEEYFRVRPETITEVGTPQFDVYARPPAVSKAQLLDSFGFEPDARLVIYGSGAPGHCPEEPEFPRILSPLCRDPAPDGDPRPIRMVVRLHPRDRLERYGALHGAHGVALEVAGRVTTHMDDRWNPTDDDHAHFVAEMRHADVVVNMASTVALDAAANDTPIVHARFDPDAGRDYLSSHVRLFDYTHTARLMSVGASLVAGSPDELVAHVLSALADPSALRDRRRALAEQEGYDGTGTSAARIADVVAAAP